MKILYFGFGMCITLGLVIAALYWTQSATASHLDILTLMVGGFFVGLPTGYFIAGIGEDREEQHAAKHGQASVSVSPIPICLADVGQAGPNRNSRDDVRRGAWVSKDPIFSRQSWLLTQNINKTSRSQAEDRAELELL